MPCTLLPSGVLHNSSSVFLQRSAPTLLPTTTTTTTAMTTTPLARFHPLQATKQPHRPQQWDSSGIGNKLCSAKSARKMTKIRNYSFHLAEKKKRKKEVAGERFRSNLLIQSSLIKYLEKRDWNLALGRSLAEIVMHARGCSPKGEEGRRRERRRSVHNKSVETSSSASIRKK